MLVFVEKTFLLTFLQYRGQPSIQYKNEAPSLCSSLRAFLVTGMAFFGDLGRLFYHDYSIADCYRF